MKKKSFARHVIHMVLARVKVFGLNLFKPPRLTAIQATFVRENIAFWSSYRKAPHSDKTSRYVLLVPEGFIVVKLQNATLAQIAASAKSAGLLCVLDTRRNNLNKRLLESFPAATFVNLDEWRYLWARMASFFQARRAFRSLCTPEDVLAFAEDGIRVGDLIYDAVLGDGFATLNQVDSRVLEKLRQFYFWRFVITDLIQRYSLDVAVLSHQVDITGGTCFRYLCKAGIEVLKRAGSGVFSLQKLRAMEDGFTEPFTPSSECIDRLLEHQTHVLPAAEQYLKTRLDGGKVDFGDLDKNLAYRKEKRLFTSRREFAEQYGLDAQKKNVFVMLHAFNDCPHYYGQCIFRDYFQWFQITLQIAREVTGVNWVFKEHPYADYYRTKDVDLCALFEGNASPHIRFLGRDANFNTKSVGSLADVLITCVGTAGLEFSANGIPCVLGGNSAYSGFGFTIEPQTVDEYEHILRSAGTLPRLSPEQMTLAKLVMYFELKIAFDAPDPFFPHYGFEQHRMLKGDQFYEDILAHRARTGLVAQQDAVQDLTRFILDRDCTQYLNTEKYEFLDGAAMSRSGSD